MEHYNETDSWSVIESYFKNTHLQQLVKHQVDSYNDFVQNQLIKTIEMFNPLIIKSPHDYLPEYKKYRLEVEINFVEFIDLSSRNSRKQWIV